MTELGRKSQEEEIECSLYSKVGLWLSAFDYSFIKTDLTVNTVSLRRSCFVCVNRKLGEISKYCFHQTWTRLCAAR